jgi:hypothetical protein
MLDALKLNRPDRSVQSRFDTKAPQVCAGGGVGADGPAEQIFQPFLVTL